jgi:hypothetical protein
VGDGAERVLTGDGSRPIATLGRPRNIWPMTHLASRIIEHYEKHATAWDRDRQNAGWNDQVWHDRFIDSIWAGARDRF